MGAMTVDRNGLDVLEREECLALLGQSILGRVALSMGALPTILPVNFRLVDGDVVFRTGVGSKFDAAARGAVIAFEVDAYEPMEHTGWSVVVTGVAQEDPSHEQQAAIPPTAIPRWAPAGTTRTLFLPTDIISGRRITHVHADIPAPARMSAL
jgi:nitroimidazol reductase NimA-like FMN-containing flavoprotein (pyridoxamine 5'-phosphate oxidase superfamily)